MENRNKEYQSGRFYRYFSVNIVFFPCIKYTSKKIC